jgi:NADH-quinone oxidoreductase subunit M
MIQRISYTEIGPRPAVVDGWDLDAREHLALWPMVVLFLVMGVAPSIWLRAIDSAATPMASQRTTPNVNVRAAAGPVGAVDAITPGGGAR